MRHGEWDNPHARTLTMVLDGAHVRGESLLIVFHGGASDAEVTLPARGSGAAYRLVWDSAWERPLNPWDGDNADNPADTVTAGPVKVTAASIRVYSLVP